MHWLMQVSCIASAVVLFNLQTTECLELSANESTAASEKLLHRVPRYVSVHTFKLDKAGRLQFTPVNVSINQQSRFLTNFGPYIIRMHLHLDRGMETRMHRNQYEMTKVAKDVVNFANTLLRPFNTYVMVTSVHFPWNALATNYDIPDADILDFIRDPYTYNNYRVMVEEVIDCVFVFVGRKHVNFTMSDSEGDVCVKKYGRPTCLGFVTLDTDRSNHAKIAGFALAHELAHRLGGSHDTVGKCQCHFTQCLMDNAVGPIDDNGAPTGWSDCSINSVATSLDSLALGRACLSAKWNSPTPTDGHSISAEYSTDWGASCGNGILEPGEQCDCGGSRACSNNRCCKGDVCQLADGAACGTGDCCNMTTCMPMGNGTICRLAEDPRCDFPEFCNGVLPTCPPDVSVLNDWPCDPASDHRCRLRHCLPPQRNAKYVGPQCDAKTHVPATTKECKLMHVAKPAEILEEFVDEVLGREDDDMSVNGTVGKEDPAYKHSVDLETADQDARQLRGIIWLVAASTTLLAALMAS